MTRTSALVGAALTLLLGVMLIAAVAPGIRFTTQRAKCAFTAKNLVFAQLAYDGYGPARHSRVIRGAFDSFGRALRAPDGNIHSDGSVAFVSMFRMGLLSSFAELACPADPFVAPILYDDKYIPTPPDDPNRYCDFPVEGLAVPSVWFSSNSIAAAQAGSTYFSYSMQSCGPSEAASVGFKMHPKFPIFADRNPYSVAQALGLGKDPNAGTETGNTWAHDRRGQNIAFMDARVEFLTDARLLPVPVTPGAEAPLGFDALYADDAINPAKPTGPVKGSCPPRGQTAWMTGGNPAGYNVWMTD